MNIKRTVPIGDILASSHMEISRIVDELVEKIGEEIEIDIEARVTFFSPGITSGPPENCYPPEGEYEHDLHPEEIASMILKQIVAAMPERLVLPTILEEVWRDIVESEQRWQDDNLDDLVWDNYNIEPEEQ